MRRLKIENAGGHVWQTKLTDAETGELLKNIVGLRLDISPDRTHHGPLVLELMMRPEHIEADLTPGQYQVTFVCPGCSYRQEHSCTPEPRA